RRILAYDEILEESESDHIELQESYDSFFGIDEEVDSEIENEFDNADLKVGDIPNKVNEMKNTRFNFNLHFI
ncbi:hypothetical protein HHI36_012991, partial [Cryptolaemus montrouzieri]